MNSLAVDVQTRTLRRTWVDWVQIFVVFALIEAALWTQHVTQAVLSLIALAAMLVFVAVRQPSLEDLGIAVRGIGGASWAVLIAVLFCFSTIAVAQSFGTYRTLIGKNTPAWHAIFYGIWALEQQFLLNSFFYRRFEQLLGGGITSVLVTAALFSVCHLPNPVLVPATFIGGVFFVAVFRRWRNIYPIAIAHAMLGLTLAMTIPDHWLRHMRVGVAFLKFHVGG